MRNLFSLGRCAHIIVSINTSLSKIGNKIDSNTHVWSKCKIGFNDLAQLFMASIKNSLLNICKTHKRLKRGRYKNVKLDFQNGICI